MRKAMWAVLIALGAALPAGAQGDTTPQCKSCGNDTFGTTIEWMGTPSEAATRAKEEKKLVFVLHVSGYFEDPKFT